MEGELLTVEEAARRLKLNPQTVRRWIRSGLLPAGKIGRREWRIAAADIELRTAASVRPPMAAKTPAPATAEAEGLAPGEIQRRTAAIEKILALRENLRGRGLSVRELMDESRRELECRGEAVGR